MLPVWDMRARGETSPKTWISSGDPASLGPVASGRERISSFSAETERVAYRRTGQARCILRSWRLTSRCSKHVLQARLHFPLRITYLEQHMIFSGFCYGQREEAGRWGGDSARESARAHAADLRRASADLRPIPPS